MDHADHVALLRDGVKRETGTWADLGAGEGAFTHALADLLPSSATIYAVDRDRDALRANAETYARRARDRDFPRITTVVGDFTRPLDLPPLDGIVMANSLHFVKDKTPLLARLREMLKRGGRLLIVEYDVDRGNAWVPYPLSFETWRRVAVEALFTEPRLLDTRSSRFLRRIYAAECERSA